MPAIMGFRTGENGRDPGIAITSHEGPVHKSLTPTVSPEK